MLGTEKFLPAIEAEIQILFVVGNVKLGSVRLGSAAAVRKKMLDESPAHGKGFILRKIHLLSSPFVFSCVPYP